MWTLMGTMSLLKNSTEVAFVGMLLDILSLGQCQAKGF